MSSFRKRNVIISQRGEGPPTPSTPKQHDPSTRPSPVTGHPTTSTGTASLDRLLGLGAGLALGSSLLIEEEGTTEFARSLLGAFAAEGVVQGHAVFVVGPEGGLSLPGVAEGERGKGRRESGEGKMKIAWRYERLGGFGERERERGPPVQQLVSSETSPTGSQEPVQPFCHTFDLTKRLEIPASSSPPRYLTPSPSPQTSPFDPVLTALRTHLSTNPAIPTRLIIPSLLSPLIYPPTASTPHHLLPFLHQLRALLRSHTNLTAMLTWPLALYPSTHPLTRYTRLLTDGVITLHPFPHSFSIDAVSLSSDDGNGGKDKREEEKMQGLISVRKLPVLSEKGVSVGVGEDMAFAVSRRSFTIRPFHLPPLEGEEGDAGGGGGATGVHEHEVDGKEGKVDAKKLEF